MAWAVALNPNNEGNQYISGIDINSQAGNSNPVWNLKFKLSAGNEASGFYRIASESIGNVTTNRILLAADLSEIRFYRGTAAKTFSLSGASIDDIFEFDSDGTQLECLVNGVSQGFISGATGVTLLNFGANFGNYSNMELEYVYYTTTDDPSLNRSYDATGSDHNSLILSDITGNDTDGGSFINMTTANWIDLGGGGNEYIITGDSSVTVIPSADFSIQRNYIISGDVPVGLTPVADFLLNRSYSIGGQSSLELSPNSGFELNREYILSGDVPFNILPDSETLYSSGNSIDGYVSYSFIPTALFEINRSYSIDGLTNIEFTVQSSKQKNINVVIGGNVPIEVTPSANFQFGIENIIDGDVNFNVTPEASFVFNRQYILNGSVGINLTPDSETETTKNYIYNGQSEVSFSVEGEFEFDGQKLINGDVQINVLPNSEMVLDRVQVIKDPLFTLSVEDEVITLSVESSVEVIYAVAR